MNYPIYEFFKFMFNLSESLLSKMVKKWIFVVSFLDVSYISTKVQI